MIIKRGGIGEGGGWGTFGVGGQVDADFQYPSIVGDDVPTITRSTD